MVIVSTLRGFEELGSLITSKSDCSPELAELLLRLPLLDDVPVLPDLLHPEEAVSKANISVIINKNFKLKIFIIINLQKNTVYLFVIHVIYG